MDLNIKTTFLFLSPFFTNSSSSRYHFSYVGENIATVSLGLSQRMAVRNDLVQWPSFHRVEGHGWTGWWFALLISHFLKWRVWHNFVETLWGHHLPQRATGSELGDTSCYSTFTTKWLCDFSGCQWPHLQSEELDSIISKNTFGFYSPWSVVRYGLISSTCPFFLLWPREHSNKLEPAEVCHRFASACSHTFIFFTGAI